MHILFLLLGVLILSAPAVGCAGKQARIVMDVLAYSDSARAPAVESFTTKAAGLCLGDRLLEQKVLALVEAELVKRGLQATEVEPDAVFLAGCGLNQGAVYEQPSTYNQPIYNWVTRERIGTYSMPVGGGQRTVYQRALILQAYDFEDVKEAVKVGRQDIVPLWSGTVTSVGSGADFLAVAPYLIQELLAEFPVGSGRPGQRTMPLKQP